MKDWMTVKQAAKLIKITPYAIYRQIGAGRIRSSKFGRSHMINKDDIKEYAKTRYSKERMKKNGKLVFDKAKGKISVKMASEILGMRVSMLYYFMKHGQLPYGQVDSTYVLNEREVKAFGKQRMALLRKRASEKKN